MGLHRSTELHKKMLIHYKINTIVFNNVHLQHQKVAIIWTKHVISIKHSCVVFMSYGLPSEHFGSPKKLLLNKSKTPQKINNVKFQHHKVGVFRFRSLEYSVLNDEFKIQLFVKMKCDSAFIQSIN